MTFERFKEILIEEGIPEDKVLPIWNGRPRDSLDERKIREAAAFIKPLAELIDLEKKYGHKGNH